MKNHLNKLLVLLQQKVPCEIWFKVVSEKEKFKDLYNFIHTQSPEARADTVGDKILIENISFTIFTTCIIH